MQDRRSSQRFRLHDKDKVSIEFIDSEQNLIKGQLGDFSRFGLGVFVHHDCSIYKKGNKIYGCRIEAYGSIKELGNGNILRVLKFDDNYFIGIYLDNEFVDLNFLYEKHSIRMQEDETRYFKYYYNLHISIKDEFKVFASDLIYGLSIYKKQLDDLDIKFKDESRIIKESLFRSLMNGLGRDLYNYLTVSMDKLKKLVVNYTKNEHENHGYYLRKLMWEYIKESEFIHRCNVKPRGYAGDSEMMEMIYHNNFLGKSSFGKIFHKHPIDVRAAQAVRNRRTMINQDLDRIIANKPKCKVLSVACGPAWEIQDFLKTHPNASIEFTLLDQDEHALREARYGIESTHTEASVSVNYLQESVRTIMKTSKPAIQFGKYDYIYSMGLFDYLTEPVARIVLEKLYSMLVPNGELLIGNYHISNADKNYMEYLMDWVLFYRDEEEMLELTDNITEEMKTEVFFEDGNTQMFLRLIRGTNETNR